MALIDSYPTSNYAGSNFPISAGDTYQKAGQTFQITRAYTISDIQFYLQWAAGQPTSGSMYVYIYKVTALTGSFPSGSPLYVSSPVSAVIAGLMTLYTFSFTGVTLLPGYYIAMVGFNGGDSTHNIAVACDATSPTHGGQMVLATDSLGTMGSASTSDAIFYLNGTQVDGKNMLQAFN